MASAALQHTRGFMKESLVVCQVPHGLNGDYIIERVVGVGQPVGQFSPAAFDLVVPKVFGSKVAGRDSWDDVFAHESLTPVRLCTDVSRLFFDRGARQSSMPAG